MQTISTNLITQKQHGAYNAVDIGPTPDPYYYAPEDGIITGVGDSGTCGFRLGMDGATGSHGFCHNEQIYVSVGQQVKRGQKLAKMGYTGYTEPAGPQGTHVHWVIRRNGVYVYPPSLVNESFKKEGDSMYPTESMCQTLTAQTGWQKGTDGKTNPNAIAYWTTGTGNPDWGDPNTVGAKWAIEVYYAGRAEGQAMQPAQYEKVDYDVYRKK